VVVDARGKHIGTHVLETSATALVDFLKGQTGCLRVCMEEGTQSLWLTEVLTPHVHELAVKAVGGASARVPKSDSYDAFDLAEQLRTHAVGRRVFKGIGPFARLRSLVKAHRAVVQDVTRVKCRMKALYRARAVKTDGKQIYAKKAREMYLAALPESERTEAMSLNAQLYALCTVRDAIEKQLTEESHQHAAAKLLETCPGIGEIRAAQILATVVTPDRFRRRQMFLVVLRTWDRDRDALLKRLGAKPKWQVDLCAGAGNPRSKQEQQHASQVCLQRRGDYDSDATPRIAALQGLRAHAGLRYQAQLGKAHTGAQGRIDHVGTLETQGGLFRKDKPDAAYISRFECVRGALWLEFMERDDWFALDFRASNARSPWRDVFASAFGGVTCGVRLGCRLLLQRTALREDPRQMR
jgi:hypothetical protein